MYFLVYVLCSVFLAVYPFYLSSRAMYLYSILSICRTMTLYIFHILAIHGYLTENQLCMPPLPLLQKPLDFRSPNLLPRIQILVLKHLVRPQLEISLARTHQLGH